jgi:two-component system, NarL family, response regulator DevR
MMMRGEIEKLTHLRWRTNGSSPSKSILTHPRPHPIRVFIADNHEVVRAGVRALMKSVRDLCVVGEVGDADDLLIEVRRTTPDVILLKSGLSSGSDVEMCKMLCDNLPMIRIIVVAWNNEVSVFRNAIEAGAQGVLLGNICREKLIQAIRTVAKGSSYLGPDGADKTLRLLREHLDVFGIRSRLQSLSPQERRIISLIAEGNTNKEIAVNLVLSDKTVKNYIGNMFAKLDITRRTQAVALYMQACHHHALESQQGKV